MCVCARGKRRLRMKIIWNEKRLWLLFIESEAKKIQHTLYTNMHSTKVIDTPYIRFGVVVVVGCRVCTCAFYSFTKCPSPTPLINNGDLLDFHSTIYTTLFFLRRVICFPRTCFFFALSIYFFVYRVRCCSVSLNSLSVCCHSICLFRRLDATTFKHGHKKNTHSDFLQCSSSFFIRFLFFVVFFLVQNLLGSRIGDSNHYIHILPMSMYKPHNIPSNVSVSVYLRIIIILWMIFFVCEHEHSSAAASSQSSLVLFLAFYP